MISVEFFSQPAFTCSKSTIETLEQGVKYVACSSVSVVNFEHVIDSWVLLVAKAKILFGKHKVHSLSFFTRFNINPQRVLV